MSDAAIDAKPAKGPLSTARRAGRGSRTGLWAISLFFLMLTGLQIFNAHPKLYFGHQSGF